MNEDPEQNSVLGNIQLLIKELEKNKSKTSVAQGSIKALQNVLDACNEEVKTTG